MSNMPRPPTTLTLGLALALSLACGFSTVFSPTATPPPTPDPLAAYARWPLVLRDTFFEPKNDWEIAEDTEGELATGRLSVSGGKYRWEVTAVQGFIWWSQALEDTFTSDFYASVDARRVSGTSEADYGLVFRHDGDNYYYFQVSDTGQYAVYLYSADEWAELVAWTETAAIRADRANKVAVAGEGERFTFFINGERVGQVIDPTLPSGAVGVGVQIYNAGESAVFEFDNFEWRAPRAAVTKVTPTPEP